MPITPDPTYSRIGLYICIFLDLRDYLSPINPLSLITPNPPTVYRVLSLSYTLYLFFLSTHPLLILYLHEIVDLGFISIPHPISKIGWVFILHSLFILPSLSVFFYYYISYLILFLYCTYYTTISSLLPVGCETPYGVCLHLIYSIIYFYCFPTFTFSLYYIFTILPYSLYLSSLLPVGCYTPTGLGYIFLSLSISSHCLPYSFYTIPDLSVLPLWHTFLLYYP